MPGSHFPTISSSEPARRALSWHSTMHATALYVRSRNGINFPLASFNLVASCSVCPCSFTGVLSNQLSIVIHPLQDGWTGLIWASSEGHEVVVETLLKGGATVDMQAKVLLFYQLFTSCMNPPTCNACGTYNDQLVLEYHLAPYCIFNGDILNSSTYYHISLHEYTDKLIFFVVRFSHCEIITHSIVTCIC